MPNHTQELGLNLAVDTDDAADYETLYLAASLTTLDGLFSQVSGHTHSGAHQGGPINGNAFGGSLDLPDWFRSTGQRSPMPTQGAGIELFWSGAAGVLQSYDRGGNAWRGMTLGSSLLEFDHSGTKAYTFDATATGIRFWNPDGSSGGSIRTRSGNGFELINSAYSAVTFGVDDSGNVSVPGTLSIVNENISGSLVVSGGTTLQTLQVNSNATVSGSFTTNGITCSTINTQNNTISSGTHSVNGDVNATGRLSTLNNPSNVAPYTVGGTPEHIEHGHPSCNGVGNNSAGTYAQTFSRAFNTNPIVLLTIDTPTSGDIKDWHVAAQNVSPSGFNIRVYNTSGNGGNVTVDWFAIGV